MALTSTYCARRLAELRACCKDRDLDDEMEATRGKVYFDELKHLSQPAFDHAINQGRKREWFPSIQDLLDLAAQCPVNEARARLLLSGRVDRGEQFSRVTLPLSHFEGCVAEYPRREGEGPMAYIVRIAELAGIPKGEKGGAWPLDAPKLQEALEGMSK